MCCSKGDRCPAKLDPSSQAVTDRKPLSAPDSYSKYAQTVEKHSLRLQSDSLREKSVTPAEQATTRMWIQWSPKWSRRPLSAITRA